jgi:hypothetical protein
MKHRHLLPVLALLWATLTLPTAAQETDTLSRHSRSVVLHGSIASDILLPQRDAAIGATRDERLQTNTYGDLHLYSRYVDAGLRVEYLDHPLPGFERAFRGYGVGHLYVTGKYRGVELTAGDFYEQLGEGLLLRSYEDRSLGIDHALRGGRLRLTALKGVRLTALGGVQRRYWDWSTASVVYGGDIEVAGEEWLPRLADRGITWHVGASVVDKREDDEEIRVPGTALRLHLPSHVDAFAVRTTFSHRDVTLKGEYAWKGSDPSADNDYTYRPGGALMLSGAYSRRGSGVQLQVRRNDNMSFRSRRSVTGTSAMLNHLPAMAYQHTYALAALYPYSTQAADGEWAYQLSAFHLFRRHTPLGGRYGTRLRFHASYVSALDKHAAPAGIVEGCAYGTDGAKASFWGWGHRNYHDIHVTVEKRLTPRASFNAMYMHQLYNKSVVEGHGGNVRSHIMVFDGKYRLAPRHTLRVEGQYLATADDRRDWCYGLVEYAWAPRWMFSLSDMWNHGGDGTHYYMGSVTALLQSHRLQLSYGRTRAGYNCAGGVCRYVPATHGLQVSYHYSF